MALVVEDGTGLSTAESYISVADTDARMTALGNTTWAPMTMAEKEQALRRATLNMIQNYRGRWKGTRVKSTQALDWPRFDVFADGFSIASNIVPQEIANACADLAFKAAAGDLSPDLTRGVVREKVGPIETEYDPASPQQTRRPAIENLLSPYLNGTSAMAGLVRT